MPPSPQSGTRTSLLTLTLVLSLLLFCQGALAETEISNTVFSTSNGLTALIKDPVLVQSYTLDSTANYIYFNFTSPQYIYNITEFNTTMKLTLFNYTKEVNLTYGGNNFSIGCFQPVENVTLSNGGNFRTCSGTYALNDSTGNGAIIIGANNVVLDCGGAMLVGNYSANSQGIFTANALNNVTIKNCKLSSYKFPIHIFRFYNYSVYDNYISNPMSGSEGIQIQRTEDNTGHSYPIVYNNIINYSNYSNFRADGIYIDQCMYLTVFNNTIILNNSGGYSIDVIKTAIVSSQALNISNNKIYLYGNNKGITFGDATNASFILNNYIEGNINSTGINNQYSWNNLIDGNIINNTLANTLIGDCIYMLYSNYSNISNNYLYNCQRSAIRQGGDMYSIYSNNYIFNKNLFDSLQQNTTNQLINNIYSSGIVYHSFTLNPINSSINETSSLYHLINLSNNGVAYFSYNGRKDLTIINNTIQINAMPTPYFDVFNGTHQTPQCHNVLCNLTLGANERGFVFSYSTSPQPRIASIDLGITGVTFDYTNNVVTVGIIGTGNVNITSLKSSGYTTYYVYKDGVFQRIGTTEDTGLTSPGIWEISNRLPPIAQVSPVSSSILTNVIGVLVLLGIVFLVGWPVYKEHEDWEVADWLKWMVVSLIVVIFGLIVVTNIFSI